MSCNALLIDYLILIIKYNSNKKSMVKSSFLHDHIIHVANLYIAFKQKEIFKRQRLVRFTIVGAAFIGLNNSCEIKMF